MTTSSARLPRAEFWEHRSLRGRDVQEEIARLDPEVDDAEITHLSLEVLASPLVAHIGYVAGATRTVAVPRVAERIVRDGKGKQVLQPVRRDRDTLGYLSALIRFGHRSHEGIALAHRLNAMHEAIGGVTNEDQVYTLAGLITGPELLATRMGRQVHSATENHARWHFWIGVGKNMNLRELPESRRELDEWIDAYERAHFEPSELGRAAADAHIHGLANHFPHQLMTFARPMIVAALGDRARACFGYNAPPRGVTSTLRALWRVTSATTPLRMTVLSRTWAF